MSEDTNVPPPSYSETQSEPLTNHIITRLDNENSQEWGVSLNITMDEIDAFEDNQDDDEPITSMLLSICPSKGVERTKVNLCCVVDVSGSMGSEAFMQSQEGISESDGLSILDLVKHALKTVISTMTEDDVLSIVSFASEAHVCLRPTEMTTIGREAALRVVDNLEPLNTTNLWDGLETGWNLLLEHGGDKFKSIFLFTDGMPNVVPPRGHMLQLHKYMVSRNEGKPICAVNTFGFGNSLDSYLLDNIARTTFGTFTFIPDVSFVGTAFINATANLYTCMAHDVTLLVKPLYDIKIDEIPGGFIHEKHENGSVTIFVGNLQFDQSRDVIVQITGRVKEQTDVDLAIVELSMTLNKGESSRLVAQVFNTEFDLLSEDDPETAEIDHLAKLYISHLRYAIVHSVSHGDVTKDQPDQKFSPKSEILGRIKAVVKDVESHHDVDHPLEHLFAMGKDVIGQITEAIDVRYYDKWGKHYLLSLANAYRSQLCNNFKDPGVQMYGGVLFKALQDNFDDIFNKLPAPKPTYRGTGGGIAPRSLAHYNSSSNPCFHGDSPVEMADGSRKAVRDIRKGDKVTSLDGTSAEIVCVVKTEISKGLLDMIKLPGDLWITPWHPVYNMILEEWMYPINMGVIEKVDCDAVFNFLLDSKHSITIGNYPCVTLCHGARGDIREHPYFGTDAVLADMKECPGFESGELLCKGAWTSPETQLICGLEFYVSKSHQMMCF